MSERISLAQALFSPRAVALVGASDRPRKNNSRPLLYLKKHGYPGKIYPVNPTKAEINGERCYPSVKDLPGPVDHALVMTPAAMVPDVIAECGEAGIRCATIFTADFAEIGEEGRRLQERLIATAKAAGVRLVGPNSMGVISTDPPMPLTPNTIMELPELKKGRLGVISHSGSLIGTFVSRGQARGLGFSKLLSVGNEADLTVGEVGEILVDDDKTDAILLFLETLRDADRIAAFARRAYDKGKPVIAYKLGKSDIGRELATSHTGAIAGTDEAVDAFLRHNGIIRVHMFETIFEIPPLVMGRPPRPGGRASVMTTTGGGGAMVVDSLGTLGVDVVPLPPKTTADLRERGIPIASGRLIDITFAGAKPENVAATLGAILDAPDNDAGIVVVGSSAQFQPQVAIDPLIAFADSPKPWGVFCVPQADQSLQLLAERGIAGFRTPETCADAIRACLNRLPPVPIPTERSDLSAVETALSEAKAKTLDEREARAVFEALGVPQAKSVFVRDPAEAARAGAATGYPAAAKVVSAAIPHKTEAGGVALGLTDDATLTQALADIRARVSERKPGAAIEGYLVQRMEKGLAEVLIGYRVDPLVGPIVALGVGGVLSEIYRDVALRLAPVSAETARDMIAEVRGLAPIRGYRGMPEGDLGALADAVVALSNLARLEGARIAEAEVNPLIVKPKGEGVVAVDGLVVLGPLS